MTPTRVLAPEMSAAERKIWADNVRQVRRLGLMLPAKTRKEIKDAAMTATGDK